MNKRPVYLHQGALRSCLGDSLSDAVNALRKLPPLPDSITTDVTGDPTRLTEDIPYRLLTDKNLKNLEERTWHAVRSVVSDALTESGVLTNAGPLKSTAVFLGSSSFLIGASEQQYSAELSAGLNTRKAETNTAIALRDSRYGLLANKISQEFGLQGGCYTFNTACTASANALMHAMRMIQAGLLDQALIVATELFNETTLLGFNNLELLTRDAMRPFDKRRNGLQLGELCAAVVVSAKQPANLSRPFVISGGANVCDAYSISAANPDGSTVWQVMQQAMNDAAVSLGDILAIKAHGTASLMNDDAESSGLKLGFPNPPAICALKPYLGHTLGACGLGELLLFCEALREGFVPAILDGFERDEKLNIALNEKQHDPGRGAFMLNYFGFGGNNTSLIIKDLDCESKGMS